MLHLFRALSAFLSLSLCRLKILHTRYCFMLGSIKSSSLRFSSFSWREQLNSYTNETAFWVKRNLYRCYGWHLIAAFVFADRCSCSSSVAAVGVAAVAAVAVPLLYHCTLGKTSRSTDSICSICWWRVNFKWALHQCKASSSFSQCKRQSSQIGSNRIIPTP